MIMMNSSNIWYVLKVGWLFQSMNNVHQLQYIPILENQASTIRGHKVAQEKFATTIQ